jgi:hypothetical protein
VNAISISTSGAYITKISSFDLVNYVTFTAQAALFENGGSLTDDGGRVRRFRLGVAQ